MNSNLFFDNKKYISAKDGSKKSGYTSDFIGQLCRANKLNCRRIGKVWYIEEDNFLDYIKNNSSEKRVKKVFPNSSFVKTSNSPENTNEKITTTDSNKKATEDIVSKTVDKIVLPFYTNSPTLSNFLHSGNGSKSFVYTNLFKKILATTFVFLFLFGSVYARNEISKTFTDISKNIKLGLENISELPKHLSQNIKNVPNIFYDASKDINTALVDTYVNKSLNLFNSTKDFSLSVKEVATNCFTKSCMENVSSKVNQNFKQIIAKSNEYKNNTVASVSYIGDVSKENISFTKDVVNNKSSNFYKKINSVFYKNTFSLKDLFTKKNIVFIESSPVNNIKKEEKKITSNNDVKPVYTNNQPRNIIETKVVYQYIKDTNSNNSVFQTNFKNPTFEDLQIVKNELLQRLSALSTGTGGNVTNIYQQIANTQRIDQLSNTTITSPTISGGSIANANISSPTITGATISSSSASLTTVNITGSTTVKDLTATEWLSVGTTTNRGTLTLDGDFYLASRSAPTNTTNKIYNTNNGDLYWNGSLIAGSSIGNWTTNGTDVWRAGGNVGIGSTTPGYKLSVAGSGFFDGGNVTASTFTATSSISTPSLTLSSLTNSLLSTNSSGQIVASTTPTVNNIWATSTTLANYFGGNVGIGTTGPGTKLDVYGAIRSFVSGGTPIIYFSNGSYQQSISAPTNNLAFNIDGVEKVRIDGSGNIGIGTTSPASKLEVASGQIFAPNGTSELPSYAFSNYRNSGMYYGPNGTSLVSGTGIVDIRGNTSGATPNIVELYLTPVSLSGSDATIQINGGQAGGSQNYRIVNAGSGTGEGSLSFRTPDQINRFVLCGTITSGICPTGQGTVMFQNTSNTTPVVFRQSGGTAGTNETHIYATASALNIAPQNSGAVNVYGGLLVDPTTTTGTIDFVGPRYNDNGIRAYTDDGAPFAGTGMIWMKPAEASGYTVLESDNDQGFRLRVNSHDQATSYGNLTVTSTGWNFLSPSSVSNLFINNSSGNVGIGSTTPGYKLSVAGSGYFDGGNVTASTFTATSSISTPSLTLSSLTNSLLSTNSSGQIVASTTPTVNNIWATSTTLANYFGGNVGIGTASPTQKLDIAGNVRLNGTGGWIGDSSANAFLPYANASADAQINSARHIILNPTSNVGIGTTAPNTILDVVKSNASYWGQTTAGTWGTSVTPPQHLSITNSQAGGYDAGLIFRMTTSAGSSKTAGSINMIGTANWADATVSNQVADMQFISRDGTGTLQERMRITSTGNVGIGTASPGYPLDVAGIIQSRGASGLGGYLSLGNLDNTGYSSITNDASSGSNELALITGGSTRIKILQGGNVGIGTASPGSKLEVAGKLTVSTTLSGDTVANFINLSSSGYGFRSQGGGGSSGLYLASFNDYAGNEKVRITDAGNVGIGTTNPLSALNVLGTTAINWAGGSNSNGLITFGTGGTSGGSLWLNTPSLNSSYHSGLGVDGTYSNPGGVGTSVVNIGAYGVYSGGGYDSALAFKTSLGLSATEKMRITSAGNVGIGTTTPGSQLTTTSGFALNQTTPATNYIGGNLMLNRADSASEFGTSNNFDLHFRTNDTRRMTILSAGNVGIGTTTPTSKLSVAMDGAFGGLTGANQLTLQGVANPDKKVVLGYDTTNNYGFIEAGITGTGYSNLALQQEGGNVGIGTTDPTGLLSLGTASQTNKLLMYDGGIGNPTAKYGFGIGANTLQIYAGADTATNRIVFGKYDGTTFTENVRFQNDGNVGIGTTTPWRTLAVTGTVGFDGLTGSTGAGSLCLDSNKQVVYNSASDSCLPSLRETKNNIADLSINALEVLQNLDPVSFVYNQGDGRTRYGFIAEDTANVNEFLATYNAEGKISGIDDRAVLSVLVKGFKELWSKVEPILAWFDNGKFSVKGDVCVDDVCVSKEQFKALLLNAGVNGNNNGGGNGGNATTTDTTSPVITLLGDNPAVITVGSVYIDLGATVTDTNENGEVNNNLGLHFNVNGVDVTDISIDTTATSTNTVVFSAVDMAGNWGYATRTVEVVE